MAYYLLYYPCLYKIYTVRMFADRENNINKYTLIDTLPNIQKVVLKENFEPLSKDCLNCDRILILSDYNTHFFNKIRNYYDDNVISIKNLTVEIKSNYIEIITEILDKIDGDSFIFSSELGFKKSTIKMLESINNSASYNNLDPLIIAICHLFKYIESNHYFMLPKIISEDLRPNLKRDSYDLLQQFNRCYNIPKSHW